tara:strand:+ start:892 stop:1158 length:267 start_codon:yes stop_codon:yes gene_type:complete
MANFISIATGVAATPNVLIGTANLCGTYATSTTVVVASAGKIYTITVGATQGAALLAAVNKAILAPSGPTVVAVDVPSTVTISAVLIA